MPYKVVSMWLRGRFMISSRDHLHRKIYFFVCLTLCLYEHYTLSLLICCLSANLSSYFYFLPVFSSSFVPYNITAYCPNMRKSEEILAQCVAIAIGALYFCLFFEANSWREIKMKGRTTPLYTLHSCRLHSVNCILHATSEINSKWKRSQNEGRKREETR